MSASLEPVRPPDSDESACIGGGDPQDGGKKGTAGKSNAETEEVEAVLEEAEKKDGDVGAGEAEPIAEIGTKKGERWSDQVESDDNCDEVLEMWKQTNTDGWGASSGAGDLPKLATVSGDGGH